MHKKSFRFAVVATSLTLIANLWNALPGNCAYEGPSPAALQAATSANAFGLALYQRISDSQPGQNCFISPLSVALCLNMAACGSAGATRTAMHKSLHLPGTTFDSASAFNALLKDLQTNDGEIELNIADAMFVNSKIPLKTQYVKGIGAAFQSNIQNENFHNSGRVLGKINKWCSDKTRGHITGIVNGVNPNDSALLLNAIYFKGQWQEPFPEESTKPGIFAQPGHHPLRVQYMKQDDGFDYLAEKDFQAIRLPYKFARFDSLIFLPRKGLKLDSFRKQFTPANWNKWGDKLSYHANGHLELPRFHVDFSESLNQSLTALGMGIAFTNQANFSRMHIAGPGLKLTEVIHKTTLDVDEKGTVATAMTFTNVGATSGAPSPDEPFRMIVDRPFIYAIRDSQTGAILFIGSICKPENLR
ncbi:MAG TPA: serpin family protein [Drouetiella sp.]